MELDDLLMLKDNLEMLASERDPKTGYGLDDSVLKSSFNKKILLDAASIIDQLLKLDFNPTRIDKRKKYAFFLDSEKREKIEISREPISISAFVYAINEQVDNGKMKKLKATQITTWLMKNGYLCEIVHSDGKKFKVATKKAETIGVLPSKRQSECGREYDVNMYDENAQKFIIDHLEEISIANIEIC